MNHIAIDIIRCLTLLSLPLLVLSCSQPIDPGPCTRPECFPISYRLSFSRVVERTVGDTLLIDGAFAIFSDYAWEGGSLYAGEVSLNGYPLSTEINGFKDPQYIDWGDASLNPIAPIGEWNLWRVSGSEFVPAFADSIVSVGGSAGLIAPRPEDTVSLSHGFEIRWESSQNGSDESATLRIALPSDTTVVLRVPDTGMYFISSSDLNGYDPAPGPVVVEIDRSRHLDGLAVGNRRYTIDGYFFERTTTTLAP